MNARRYAITFLLLMLGVLLITACTSSTEEPAAQGSSADEHGDSGATSNGTDMDHAHVAAPDEFATLTNPFAGNDEAVAAGKVIFETSCATCHGPEGRGDGPAAEALDPKPATLADGAMMNTLSDGYLFWRVSKGGMMEPFNSAMPAWETGLTEDQRWQVISYVRTLVNGGQMDMDSEHADDGEHSD